MAAPRPTARTTWMIRTMRSPPLRWRHRRDGSIYWRQVQPVGRRRVRLPTGVAEDGLAGLLRDHVDRRHDEETRDLGEYRRVDHPQPLDSLDPEVGVQDGFLPVVLRTDPAGTAG